MKRIYDATFETTNGTAHHHLGTFWWEEAGLKGRWTRSQAYDYVSTHDLGDVYVREGSYRVNVRAYYDNKYTPPVRWIQTEADGVSRDNLIELARRHAAGLPNL